MYILGISALYHDSAAALIEDGRIVAAAQEERFTRIKMDRRLPENSIRYCLQEAGLDAEELDAVVYYDDPALTLHRYTENVKYAGGDAEDLIRFSFDSIFKEKLWIEKLLRNILGRLGKADRLYVVRHHLSHAASAFYPSPFDDAAILTIDGVGEWDTTTIGYGSGKELALLRKLEYPHSLGLLYSAFTYFCGFRVNFGDYKLMGLAPYGEPVYAELIREELIHIQEDGSFELDLSYFDFQYGRAMTNEKFAALFGGERRQPEGRITRREMDLAASVQAVTEEVVMKLAKTAKELTGARRLVMAGGVALNCVANGRLLKSGLFDDLWVQPVAGDAGGAAGAALALYHIRFDGARPARCGRDLQQGSFLGPAYSSEAIIEYLDQEEIPYHQIGREADLFDGIAELLDAQKVVGVFAGRMEYGPRALGHRSILADPRSEEMQSRLNLSIKYRESFRPFAPAVLRERCSEYFDVPEGKSDLPYMLICADVREREDEDFDMKRELDRDEDLLAIVNRKRSGIPAVTHVDYSARVQTVDRETNPFFCAVLRAFEKKTGCGVLINTSFNVRGEPIVCSPEDAYHCFMNTEMDALVLEDVVLYKEEQPETGRRRDRYEPD